MHVSELAFVRFATHAALNPQATVRDLERHEAGLDWPTVVRLAAHHRATGFVSQALRLLPAGIAPDISRQQLDAGALAMVARTLAALAETAAALDLLRGGGVRAVAAPSPGFELFLAGARPCDLRQARLVLAAEDLPRASRLLQTTGYRTELMRGGGTTTLLAQSGGRPPVIIDTGLAPSFSRAWPLTPAIDRAADVRLSDRVLHAFLPDDRLLALCARAAAKDWARLDYVAATGALARAIDDWPSLLERSQRLGLRRAVVASLLLARDVLDLDVGPDDDLKRDAIARRIASEFGARLIAGTEPTSTRAALLQISARTGPADRARYTGVRAGRAVAAFRARIRQRRSTTALVRPARVAAPRLSDEVTARPVKLMLRQGQSPGDLVMLTAAVRELHVSHPRRFLTDVRTPCPDLWLHNPYITPLADDDPEVQIVHCEYPLIHQSNQRPVHFVHGFIEFLNDRLDLQMRPTAFKGDIWLSDAERQRPSPVAELTGHEAPYWVVAAGGKLDFTIKWWTSARYQQVIDHFQGRLTFVQIGEPGHHHPLLDGVIDLRGRTNLRDLIRLVYRADGVVGPVSLLMHLAAAVETPPGRPPLRPSVVIAGGREPVAWEAYPGHQFLHTIGALPCCASGGCWRSRTLPIGDGDSKDEPDQLCVDVVGDLPHCMDLIRAEDVIRSIELFLPPSTAVGTRASAAIRRERIIERADAPVGLVIGTFAAVPYIHLALESRLRHYPGLPVLVHDDGSPMTETLRALCRQYGVDFSTNPARTAPTVGDLSSYVCGLEWAHERKIELLVKMSRRFLVFEDWAPALQRLAYETQYATYSQRCRHFDFGFRTECVAFHVDTWRHHRALPAMRGHVERNESTFVEGFVHQLARAIHRDNCAVNREYERRQPRPPEADAYGVWTLMADRRVTPQSSVLWHDANDANDYWRVAAAYGLPYTVEDFADPNQGFGAAP